MTNKFNRRRAIAGFGTVSLGALLAACSDDEGSSRATTTEVRTTEGATTTVEPRGDGRLADLFEDAPSCALTPEQTEGPFYFDADAIRSDIREGREGVPLRLGIRVRDARSCEPLPNAVVDIWHCDALGSYSAFGAEEGETYLRGAQVTDRDGIVEFTTVYPGWYTGRTVHVHAKAHLDRQTVLTTQLYFDEDVTASVFERAPYSSRPGRDAFNVTDGVFDERLVLRLTREGEGRLGLISFDVEAA